MRRSGSPFHGPVPRTGNSNLRRFAFIHANNMAKYALRQVKSDGISQKYSGKADVLTL